MVPTRLQKIPQCPLWIISGHQRHVRFIRPPD
jgi:hypothetical protein